MEAQSRTDSYFEPEPATWQPRVMWVSGRMMAGAITFFFLSFVFAYFYLRSLDLNRNWKIGHVSPPIGWGIAIIVALVASAVVLRFASRRPAAAFGIALVGLVLGLVGVGLQAFEWTQLSFGAASGGYASVFIGWTVTYAALALPALVIIEMQVASVWRARSEGWGALGREVGEAGFETTSFYWAYYVFIGFVAFVLLYLL